MNCRKHLVLIVFMYAVVSQIGFVYAHYEESICEGERLPREQLDRYSVSTIAYPFVGTNAGEVFEIIDDYVVLCTTGPFQGTVNQIEHSSGQVIVYVDDPDRQSSGVWTLTNGTWQHDLPSLAAYGGCSTMDARYAVGLEGSFVFIEDSWSPFIIRDPRASQSNHVCLSDEGRLRLIGSLGDEGVFLPVYGTDGDISHWEHLDIPFGIRDEVWGDSGEVLIATDGGGLYTIDMETEVASQIPTPLVNLTGVDVFDSAMAIADWQNGAAVSEDGGLSWRIIYHQPVADVQFFSFDGKVTLLLATEHGVVFAT